MTTQELAEEMLRMLTSSLLETAQKDRVFSEDEFYAIKNCYKVAKPHLSLEFERQWCGNVLQWLDRDELWDKGESSDTFNDFMATMIPDKLEGEDETH